MSHSQQRQAEKSVLLAVDSLGRGRTQPEGNEDSCSESGMQQALGALWKAVSVVQGSGFQTAPQSPGGFGVSPRVSAEGEG